MIQIDVFRSLRDEEGHKLTHNFRPIQPLGDRVVWLATNKTITKHHGSNDSKSTDSPQPSSTAKPELSSKEDINEDDLDSTGKKVEDIDDNRVDTQTKHPKHTGKKNSGVHLEGSQVTMFVFTLIAMLFAKKFTMFLG